MNSIHCPQSASPHKINIIATVILITSLLISTSFAADLVNPFLQQGNWYKAALHVHTTTSDGDVNVPERIEQYRDLGFNIVAITDHNKTNKIKDFCDDKFLAISGMETQVRRDFDTVYHLVCLNIPEDFQDDPRDPQQVIDRVKAAGGEVIIGHPYWSGLTLDDMQILKGWIGMEVYNGSSQGDLGKAYSSVHWDQLIGKGDVVPATAVDDVHESNMIGMGWTMIKAKELKPDSVMQALKSGSFYSSCGPVIEEFKLENGIANIKCSEVSEILFLGKEFWGYRVKTDDGKLITSAQWKIPESKKEVGFVRAEIIDVNGKHAWTNPIVIE